MLRGIGASQIEDELSSECLLALIEAVKQNHLMKNF